MLIVPSKSTVRELTSRRGLLAGGGRTLLSATAVAMLAGCTGKGDAMAQTSDQSKGDVDILNTALGLEYEGIAAYQVGAESGLLQQPVLKLAVGFQSDHKQHAEALVKAITSMGGTPVQPKTVAEYSFPTSSLHSQTDVLKFAAGLEQGAVSAYKGAIPLFANRDLAGAGASILGSEAMHWAILNSALGVEPPAVAFVS